MHTRNHTYIQPGVPGRAMHCARVMLHNHTNVWRPEYNMYNRNGLHYCGAHHTFYQRAMGGQLRRAHSAHGLPGPGCCETYYTVRSWLSCCGTRAQGCCRAGWQPPVVVDATAQRATPRVSSPSARCVVGRCAEVATHERVLPSARPRPTLHGTMVGLAMGCTRE